jgi:hypothetical protein
LPPVTIPYIKYTVSEQVNDRDTGNVRCDIPRLNNSPRCITCAHYFSILKSLFALLSCVATDEINPLRTSDPYEATATRATNYTALTWNEVMLR